MDLERIIERQKEFSKTTFGPFCDSTRTCRHIIKEVFEIIDKPNDLSEWADILILAMDGAWRQGYTPAQIQEALIKKMDINARRKWPDWRDFKPGEPIEHMRDDDWRKM